MRNENELIKKILNRIKRKAKNFVYSLISKTDIIDIIDNEIAKLKEKNNE